jgi:serine/threonine protein kinase
MAGEPTRDSPPASVHSTNSTQDPASSLGDAAATQVSAAGSLQVANRYEIRELIAEGGMGGVYRAIDHALHRPVAIKVLHSKFAVGSAPARRFNEEARITGQLQHPNIPAVHDLGTLSDGRPFLAMKLIKGETLDERLRQRSESTSDRGSCWRFSSRSATRLATPMPTT